MKRGLIGIGFLLVAMLLIGCGKQGIDVITGQTVLDNEALQSSCSANICYTLENKEVYCPDEYDECVDNYSYCRIIECENNEVKKVSKNTKEIEAQTYEYSNDKYDSETYESSLCEEEYNDCFDNGEAITCKGSFELCAESFDDCICGTDEVTFDSAKPEFDSGNVPDCDTGIYVCEKHSLSMDGTPTVSKVTCKSTFAECSGLYGKCECGDSSLTDFGTISVGDAGIGSGNTTGKCDFHGDKVPCYMIIENPKLCSKSTHTCKSGDRWLQCEGSMPYCNNVYDDQCLCGVENLGYGEFYTG